MKKFGLNVMIVGLVTIKHVGKHLMKTFQHHLLAVSTHYLNLSLCFRMGKAKQKTPMKKEKWFRGKRSGAVKKTRKTTGPSLNHKGQHIQLWAQDVMVTAWSHYFKMRRLGYTGQVMGYKAVADLYSIPRETFRRRTTWKLKGFAGYLSGGKNILELLLWKKN